MRPDDPLPRRTRRPSIREKVDRELRPTIKRALLGDGPLPSRRWKEMHSGRTRPVGILAELAQDARDAQVRRRQPAPDLRTALRTVADAMADVLEQDDRRAA